MDFCKNKENRRPGWGRRWQGYLGRLGVRVRSGAQPCKG